MPEARHSKQFRIPVADLLRHPGDCRQVVLSEPLADLAVAGSHADGDVTADLSLQALPGHALMATGTVAANWVGECRRCLGPASGQVTAEVRELFEAAGDEEETYRLDRDQVDVEPLVRDAVLLELPLAPLCREACQGLCPECGANRNDVDCGHEPDTSDPRWAALDKLKD